MNQKISLLRVSGTAVVLAALVLPALHLSAAEYVAALDGDAVRQRVEGWIAPYVAARDFSGVVLIAQDDRVLVQRAYGMADFARKVPNNANTRFRAASLSKTFTAAAIELLIAEHKVSLDDTLDRFVKGVPNGDAITVRHLLEHESGVGTLDSEEVVRHCLSNPELLSRLITEKPLFKPGEKSQYSNEGYFLLALIIEKVSGLSYQQYLRVNIFQPLALRNTDSACQEIPSGNRALGHVPGAETLSVQQVDFAESMQPGPGSIYSNAHDLYRWLAAVDTNPRFKNAGYKYPYGWGKRNYSGKDLIEQSGIVDGFDAHIALYPKEHIYAVVLSNIQSGLFNRIPKDLEAVLFGGEPSHPPAVKAVPLAPKTMEDYAGSFTVDAIPVPLNISERDGVLRTQWGKNPLQRILTPVGKDEFFFRSEYAQVRFQRDEAGRVTACTWQWPQGDPITFKRQ